jgi:uncharacterized repeat protein (TIGR03803 family)
MKSDSRRTSLPMHRLLRHRTILGIVIYCFLTLCMWAQNTETVLYSFNSAPDGNYPHSNLIFDKSGSIFGTTVQGGISSNCGSFTCGTVFELMPSNGVWTEKVIYEFCQQTNCLDGAKPYAGLVFDGAGNLYGTASAGGTNLDGVVFELTPQSNGTWTEQVLHSFGTGTDGQTPMGGVIFDDSGNLYGTTESGGANDAGTCSNGCGMVFELSPTKSGEWEEQVLYNFCSQNDCGDGSAPITALTLDKLGNLYGTTEYGGSQVLNGTVFQLKPNGTGGWNYQVLYKFSGGDNDGLNPASTLILDRSMNLYGTTEYGGNGNNGTVFELVLVPASSRGGLWREKVIANFCLQINCGDGSSPSGGLTLDTSGDLYGTTTLGGEANSGTVFELIRGNSGEWNRSTLYTFGGPPTDGANPSASVTLGSSGSLYGATSGGGNGYGTVFEIVP